MAKLSGANFEAIETAAVKIISEKSKDIRVLSFLAFIYLRLQNWEAFTDIFEGLGLLIERDYDGLFPTRPVGKQLALKWLKEERFTRLLDEYTPTATDYNTIVRLNSALKKIKPILEEKFPDGSPFPSLLFTNSQKWERSCKPKEPPKEEAKPEPETKKEEPASSISEKTDSAATIQTPAMTQTLPPIQPTVAPPSGSTESPKDALMSMRETGMYLVRQLPNKAIGYRLMRFARWDIIEQIPFVEGGKIKLEGPNPQRRAYFQKLLSNKDWKSLLTNGETAFSEDANHFWLDLQRFITTACSALGSEYESIRHAILIETSLLCKRLPDLISLQYIDGTPFCDDVTKDWLSSEVQAVFANDNDGGTGGTDPLIEEMREINKLTAANQFAEAITLIQKNIQSSSSIRDNFRRTVAVASLLCKVKQPDIAVSLLESLESTIERHQISVWDPPVAAEAWGILVTAYKLSRQNKSDAAQAALQTKISGVLGKIYQIDPKKAFSLST